MMRNSACVRERQKEREEATEIVEEWGPEKESAAAGERRKEKGADFRKEMQ